MSREMKFRAWDTRRNKMWSAEEMGRDQLTLSPDGKGFINVHGKSTQLSTYLPHLIPLQHTGLKDEHGNDLDWWEDDLLRLGSAHPNAPIARITYSEQDAKWLNGSRTESSTEFCGLAEAYRSGWKKIGNIHDNAELMKEKP